MDTAASIRDYIRVELLSDDNAFQDDTPLWGGVIDSAGLMQLITFIEEEFAIEIEDEELTSSNFGTVTGIATLIDQKVATGERLSP